MKWLDKILFRDTKIAWAEDFKGNPIPLKEFRFDENGNFVDENGNRDPLMGQVEINVLLRGLKG